MPVILLKNFEFFFVSPSFVAALVLSVQKKIDFFLVSPCVVASMPEKKMEIFLGVTWLHLPIYIGF